MNYLANCLKFTAFALLTSLVACSAAPDKAHVNNRGDTLKDLAGATVGRSVQDDSSAGVAVKADPPAAVPAVVLPASCPVRPAATPDQPATAAAATPAVVPATQAPTGAHVVTYSGDIQPIIVAQCVACHAGGGQSPNLSGGQVATADQESVVKAVTGGSMPFGGSLPQSTKDLFATWATGGYSRAATALALLDLEPSTPAANCPSATSTSPSAPPAASSAATPVASSASSPATPAMPTVAKTDATKDMASLVQYINGLPKPLTIAGFVSSLPRPFGVNGTYSQSSLQPACDVDNPRIFISSGSLILAVVPRGVVSNQLEIAMSVSGSEQVLGAINFPVTDSLTEESLYQTTLDPKRTTGTGCGANSLCHVQERPYKVVGKTTTYASHKVTPLPIDIATLAKMMAVNDSCTDQSSRCQMYNAIFSAKPVPTDYVWPFAAFTTTSVDFVTSLPDIVPQLTTADTPGGALINPSTTCARTAALPKAD